MHVNSGNAEALKLYDNAGLFAMRRKHPPDSVRRVFSLMQTRSCGRNVNLSLSNRGPPIYGAAFGSCILQRACPIWRPVLRLSPSSTSFFRLVRRLLRGRFARVRRRGLRSIGLHGRFGFHRRGLRGFGSLNGRGRGCRRGRGGALRVRRGRGTRSRTGRSGACSLFYPQAWKMTADVRVVAINAIIRCAVETRSPYG